MLIASLSGGGAERVALALLKNLLSAGIEAHLLTLDRNRDLLVSDSGAADEFLSGRCIQLSRANIRWNTVLKVLIFPWQWLMLQHTIRRLRLDAVLSLMERANIANLLTLSGHRRIISVHSYAESMMSSKGPLKRSLIKCLYPFLLHRADRVVLVSKEAATSFQEMFRIRPEQAAVIYNMCDLGELKERAREALAAEYLEIFERPVIITHGRLIADKGHWQLIRAFAEVKRTNQDLRLVILGQGPLEADLRRLCRDLDIQDEVFFPGFRPNPMPWLVKAHLFVLSSLREGLPGSLLEAMALGVPIVATDCRSGPRELLAPGTNSQHQTQNVECTPCGLLTPPLEQLRASAGAPLTRAERLLARAMVRMLSDRELRTSSAGAAQDRAREFSPETVTLQWLRLIEKIH